MDTSMALVNIDVQAVSDFDPEAADREDLHIEELLREFEDEPPIRHDKIPDSDSDGEYDPPPDDDAYFRRRDGRLFRDQSFFNGVAFKEAVLDYALQTGRNVTEYRYDKDKIGFKCLGKAESSVEGVEGKCDWQVYASIRPNCAAWKIRIFKDEHSCVPNGTCDLVKVPVIARMFLNKIRNEPEYYMPMKIEETIKERWNITVTRPQCQAARNNALRWIAKEYDHQFSRLRDYAAEIMQANENSVVEIETLTNSEGQDEFNRFYVCFDVLRRSWKDSCRPVIGVDGTFLKTRMKGQLLAAIGRDADNAIYPIAWAVVQVENKPNWLWFVKKLKTDLGLEDGDGFILISDRQKGLISAVERELPKIEHRLCVKHLYGNLKNKHGNKPQLKPLLWHLAWSYNEAEYRERLDRIFCYDSVLHADVMKTKPKTWCRAFYKTGNFCEDVENNFTESYNKTVKKAREQPLVPMLETIRTLAMARIAKRSAKAQKHKALCTPYATDILAAEYEKAKECRVIRSTNNMFEATIDGCSYRVSLDNKTCSCKKWDICGIPCEHGYGVIIHKKLLAEDFVCSWFKTAMWKRNYAAGLIPQRGPRFWPASGGSDIHVPPVPNQPGRKKVTKADKKRKRSQNESPTRQQPKHKKREIHCGICGAVGHNSLSHKKHKAGEGGSQAASGASQAASGGSQAAGGGSQSVAGAS